MKRTILALILMALMLAGCNSDSAQASTAQTVHEPTEETTPKGLYVPETDLERDTLGAIKVFHFDEEQPERLYALDDRLVVLSKNKGWQLQLFRGEDCIPGEIAQLPKGFDPEKDAVCTTYRGVTYYDTDANAVVVLDPQLQQMQSHALPEDASSPVLSPDGNIVYYCIGQDVYALDLEQGLSRLVRQQICARQQLLQCSFDGKLLVCQVQDELGNSTVTYLSTEDGRTTSTDQSVSELVTRGDEYLLRRLDGLQDQLIYGKLNGSAQQIRLEGDKQTPALELGGVLNEGIDEDGNLTLEFYDLQTGLCVSRVTLKGTEHVNEYLPDAGRKCLWIVCDNGELLQWRMEKSTVEEAASCLATLYTAAAPDTAGIQTCQKRVDALNKTHSLRIRIWQDAVKYPHGYTLEKEYQVDTIQACLNTLENILTQFPENFFYRIVNSQIRICIVRSVDGSAASAQFWEDGDAFIILSSGMDIREAFLKELGYIVDSHILGNSPVYDYWADANPEGFAYGAEDTYDPAYLEGETRAFADQESMDSVITDRSRIFWQAMQPDNQEMFASEMMQSKLEKLCRGIRDAWRWEKKKDVYPWEQYLEKSIAYTG